MSNIIDYIRMRGDIPFSNAPLNKLDIMALSLLPGLDFEGMCGRKTTLFELGLKYREANRKDADDKFLNTKEEMFLLMADSRRFGSVIARDYTKNIDTKAEMTFYAMTLEINPFNVLVAYRGTDGSLISWKENYTTIYKFPTKGQELALSYLDETMSKRKFAKCIVAGHSKGGNLALFSGLYATDKLQKKIKAVYCFDAPGMMEDITQAPGYEALLQKLQAYVPVSCVIGNLMNPPIDKKIVRSTGAATYQHDLFTWEVNAKDFIYADNTDEFSKNLSKRINDWITGINPDERERVVNELFEVFTRNNISHINQLLHADLKTMFGIVMSLTSISKENRELLILIFREILIAK